MDTTHHEYQHIHLLSTPGQSGNKADFETQLARPIVINRLNRLYVCLTELNLPNSVESSEIKAENNIRPRIGIFCPFLTQSIEPGKFVRIYLPDGLYNPISICETLNDQLKAKLGEEFTQEICHFLYNEETGKVEVTVNGDDPLPERKTTVIIMASIGVHLGFMDSSQNNGYIVIGAVYKKKPTDTTSPIPAPIHKSHAIAAFTCPLHGHFDYLFCYLDIVTLQ